MEIKKKILLTIVAIVVTAAIGNNEFNKVNPVSQEMCSSLKILDDPENAVFDNFSQTLCKGKVSVNPHIKKNLKCRYTDKKIPFLKIAPLKEEDAFLKPRITIYHNVLSNEEIKTLKKLAYPLLKDALVRSREQGISQSKSRVSKVVWLKDSFHQCVKNVNRRVELITDLTVDTAEELQVCYYQKNGYFNAHYDFEPNKINPFQSLGVGNRIATLMFYLSDVIQGGRTIFPYLNVSLVPKKGSAVFWYNLFPNGEFDYRTFHAGCPVVKGTKWVGNKWIHEFGQEFRRPCTLLNYKWKEDGTLSVK